MTQTKWKIERNIPLSLLFAIAGQTAAFIWWTSGMAARVTYLENQVASASWQAEKIIRLEERMTNVQTGVDEIKALIQGRTTVPSQPPQQAPVRVR